MGAGGSGGEEGTLDGREEAISRDSDLLAGVIGVESMAASFLTDQSRGLVFSRKARSGSPIKM